MAAGRRYLNRKGIRCFASRVPAQNAGALRNRLLFMSIMAWLGIGCGSVKAQERTNTTNAAKSVFTQAQPGQSIQAATAETKASHPVVRVTGHETLEILPSRHLALRVILNGKGPFRMILDTGSPITFITNAAALKSGLLKAQQANQPALFGMRGQVIAKTIGVGKTLLNDFPLLVLDHPVIETLQQVEGPLDGILGFSFFARYRTVIDYVHKSAQFTPNGYQPEDLLGSLMTRLMSNQASHRNLASLGLWGMEVAQAAAPKASPTPKFSQPGQKAEQNDPQPGIIITRVYADSAAAQSGLQAGDRLLSVEEHWTDTLEDCLDAAGQIKPGEKTTLHILRDGKPLDIVITPRIGL